MELSEKRKKEAEENISTENTPKLNNHHVSSSRRNTLIDSHN